MTRNPNFPKFMMGIAVLALLFIGTWASTSDRLSPSQASRATLRASRNAVPALAQPLASPSPDLISSVFEVDGDISDNPPGGAQDDWSALNCDSGMSVVKTFLNDGLGTTIFTQGGSKDPSDLGVPDKKGVVQPGWLHTAGSVPDKDEILNAYAALYTGDPNGDKIVAFGADRYSNQGDSFFGAWFFQKNVYAAADGTFRERIGATPASGDPIARHVAGDLLVLINFTGGGGIATGQVLEWVPVGTPCPAGALPIGQPASKTLCDITGTAPAGSVLGTSNDLTGFQDIPDNCLSQVGQTLSWDALYTPKTGTPGIIPAAHFFEGAINLDAFPALREACFNTFLIETRSSSSPSAQLKDFVLGEFDTCVEIGLTKEADDNFICEGTPTEYTYTVTNPTSNNVNITLVDDNGTANDATDDVDVLDDCASYNLNGNGTLSSEQIGPGDSVFTCTRTLPLGEHTNIAKVVATIGGNTDEASASATVEVSEPPIADAGADQSVCKNAGFGTHDFSLSGTVSNGTPSWQILAGNTAGCIIVNPPGASTLTPTVRCTGFGTATLQLTATSDAPSGTDCPVDTDELVVTIKPNATASAGDDQEVCVDDTFTSTNFELNGSVSNATPSWSILAPNSAGCTIAAGEETTANPTVTCTALGSSTVRLTAVSDNSCTNATSDLVLTVNANPEADAGPDQTLCSAGLTTPFTLAGTADHGTTEWECLSGDCSKVQIADPSSLTSGVTFTGTGSATLQLTTTAASGCGPAMSEVVLTVDPNPVVTICGDEACSTDDILTLTANVTPAGGDLTYKWTGPAGGISGADNGPSISVLLPGNYTVEVTRKATPGSPACPDSETMHVGLCPGGVCSP